MTQLYVSDLDGTLLNTQSELSEKTIKIINDLVDEGMIFTYATARSLVSSKVVTDGISTKWPVIVYNGVYIMEPDTGKILYSMENDGVVRYINNRDEDPRMNPLVDKDHLFDGDVFYCTCIGTEEELTPMYQQFSKDKMFRCTLQQELYRPEFWLEIMPCKGSKSEAIKVLKEMLGCDEVTCFGDAVNDIPMFDISQRSYTVSNAVTPLKEIATEVIGSNDEDGVAKWLLEHVGKE